MIEDVSLPLAELMTRLAANAPETQGLLNAAHDAGLSPSRLAVSELAVRMELHMTRTRAVGGSLGVGLAALPLGAYIQGAYRGAVETTCVLELTIRQTPVPPA